MASRILHLAAAKLILDEHPAADEKRFRLGSILPDAGERVSAHFRVRIDGGTKTMMALGGFRARFADKMDDPLYLGYYLHLVQDIVFARYSISTTAGRWTRRRRSSGFTTITAF